MNKTFTLTWKDALNNPPKEIGRYWCVVEELTDLGTFFYQWNCNYNPNNVSSWSDNHKGMNVKYWTELAPLPF